MTHAKHMKSTNDRKVFATGKIKNGVATMRVACAWCHVLIRAGDEPTSHGICDPCAEVLMLKTPLKRLARAIRMYGDAVANKEHEGAAYARALAWVDREVGVR